MTQPERVSQLMNRLFDHSGNKDLVVYWFAVIFWSQSCQRDDCNVARFFRLAKNESQPGNVKVNVSNAERLSRIVRILLE